mgnify:CR=1 FL=1
MLVGSLNITELSSPVISACVSGPQCMGQDPPGPPGPPPGVAGCVLGPPIECLDGGLDRAEYIEYIYPNQNSINTECM